jgi:hypothetical protein
MVHGELATSKPVSSDVVRDLLRSSVGEEISVSAGKTGVFLYAATADAAGIAERIADEVLARQGLGADIRLERWDPSREAWLDVRTGLPADVAAADVLPGRGRSPGRRRLRSAGALIAAIIDGIGGDWLYPGIRVVACGGVGASLRSRRAAGFRPACPPACAPSWNNRWRPATWSVRAGLSLRCWIHR